MAGMRCVVLVGVCWAFAGCANRAPDTPTAEAATPSHPADALPAEAAIASVPATSEPTAPPSTLPAAEPVPVAKAAGAATVALDARQWTRAGLQFRVPATWVPAVPRNDVVLAEFTLPRAEGDSADGRLTFAVAGGSVDENLAMWQKQFDDQPAQASRRRLCVGGLWITLVDYSGVYRDQASQDAAVVEHPHFRMLGAIVELGRELRFLKACGPAQTIARHADGFQAVVESLRIADRSTLLGPPFPPADIRSEKF